MNQEKPMYYLIIIEKIKRKWGVIYKKEYITREFKEND